MPNDGGPAFPVGVIDIGSFVKSEVREWPTKGISIRDYFAAAALTGFIAATPEESDWPKCTDAAESAFNVADAMIAEREKRSADRPSP